MLFQDSVRAAGTGGADCPQALANQIEEATRSAAAMARLDTTLNITLDYIKSKRKGHGGNPPCPFDDRTSLEGHPEAGRPLEDVLRFARRNTLGDAGVVAVAARALEILKQAGIIEKNISTWPYPLAAFGILLIIGSINKLRKLKAETS